ncbi:C45 family autoproteolytic acyltransferase/hydolase [Amycolatopsis endophytica]
MKLVTPENPKALGAECAAKIRATFEGYLGLFAAHGVGAGQVREWGDAALEATRSWAPSLAAEITGVAEGSGLEPWQLGALNGRTEILAAAAVTGEGECSTSVVLPADGPPRTVQTWDWHDTLRGGMTVVAWPGLCTFTEFGLVGKIGVNSAGLGVHFNVLRHQSDSPDIGVPVHVVARRILDEARTVEEATELASSARMSASSVVTVVAGGRARCLELSPAGIGVIDPVDGFLVHTNHFLDPALSPGERTTVAVSTTLARAGWLRSHADALAVSDRTARARALCAHTEDGAAVCAHPDPGLPPHERWESLATVSLDVTAARMHVHTGGPCTVTADSWHTFTAIPR